MLEYFSQGREVYANVPRWCRVVGMAVEVRRRRRPSTNEGLGRRLPAVLRRRPPTKTRSSISTINSVFPVPKERPVTDRARAVGALFSNTVNYSYTGLGLGLRFRVRYIRNPVYPNTRMCTNYTASCFCAGLKLSVRYVRIPV